MNCDFRGIRLRKSSKWPSMVCIFYQFRLLFILNVLHLMLLRSGVNVKMSSKHYLEMILVTEELWPKLISYLGWFVFIASLI